MYDRPHHQRIAKVLKSFDTDFLYEADCFFGGGTAITLQLDEYRESVDIDFLCGSVDGYLKIRRAVSSTLGPLLKNEVKHAREVRADQDKISTILEMDGEPIKVEIFKEKMLNSNGVFNQEIGLYTLSRSDFYAQKLFANSDRCVDPSSFSRDIIDLALMLQKWGDFPDEAWNYAYKAYGDLIVKGFHLATNSLSNPLHLTQCLEKLKINPRMADSILETLESVGSRLPLSEEDKTEQKRRIRMIAKNRNKSLIHESIWSHSEDAIKLRPVEKINWAKVEQEVIADTLKHFPYWEIANVIMELSPGATSPHRQELLYNKIERMAEQPGTKYQRPKP